MSGVDASTSEPASEGLDTGEAVQLEQTESEATPQQEVPAAADPSPCRGLFETIPRSAIIAVVVVILVVAIAVGIAVPLSRKDNDTSASSLTAGQSDEAPTEQPTTSPADTTAPTTLQRTTFTPSRTAPTVAPSLVPSTSAPSPFPPSSHPSESTFLPTSSPFDPATVQPSRLITPTFSQGPTSVTPTRILTVNPTLSLKPSTVQPTTVVPSLASQVPTSVNPTPLPATAAPTTVPSSETPTSRTPVTSHPAILTTDPPIQDPFLGVDDAPRWETTGSGLRLDILNALEEKYQLQFNLAVADWNASKAVALTVTRLEPEQQCNHVKGVLKACNGNYGQTGWRGFNEILLQDGFILSSTVKVNDYYLDPGSTVQTRYVVCHEIGHGLGLPHTDENFFNENLGNCMDLTSMPETNKSPDQSIFNFLLELYGPLQRQRRLTARSDENV